MKRQGFIDLQVNGLKGINFSLPGLTLDKVRTVTQELVKAGTIAYCPTLVTSPMDIYRENLPVLAQAKQDKELSQHILGIHLEGPFISSNEGARGAHPPEHIIKPNINIFRDFLRWGAEHIVLLTLSPEADNALALIRFASENGIVVCLGHHVADDSILEQAVHAGARACTHLGNGMPNMINRHQNPLWWQMACDDIYGTFITDGHHLPPDFIQVALRAKGVDRFIVISDATSLAGLPPGAYDHFHGNKAVLASSGRINFADTPYLAGSSATMLQCMNYLASLHLLNEPELWRTGFDNALQLLGIAPDSFSQSARPVVEFRDDRFFVS